MKLYLVVALTLAFTEAAFAAKNSVVGNFGFDQGAMTIGAEFENRSKKTTAMSAFLLYAMDNAEYTAGGALTKGKLGHLTFGGGVKIFMGTKRWNFFVTPAFGINMVDTLKASVGGASIETETTFGPILRSGVYYRYSMNMAFGLDYTQAFNWFSDIVGPKIEYLTFGLRYTL